MLSAVSCYGCPLSLACSLLLDFFGYPVKMEVAVAVAALLLLVLPLQILLPSFRGIDDEVLLILVRMYVQ